MYNNVEEIYNTIRELQQIGEVIAGTDNEGKMIRYIERTLRDNGLEVRKQPVKIMTWNPVNALIHVEEKEYMPTVQPYSPTAQVEGRIVYVGHGLLEEELRKIKPHETIALAKLHENLDYYETQYTNIMEQGALAIIFYDPYPGRKRKLVASGSTDYHYRPGKPLRIPVLHVTLEEGKELMKIAGNKQRIQLEVKTRIIHDAKGYNIISTIPGKYEDKQIIVSAHHDHWFTGASDNLVGIAIVLYLAKILSKKHYNATIKIISFTAEESGAPAYTPWYWAYGSRRYVEELEHLNKLDDIIAVVNVDAVARTPISINATGIEFQALLEVIAENLDIDYKMGYDHPYCDSYSFSMKGVPSVCINSIDAISDIYHTDLDTVEVIEKRIVEQTISLIHKAIDYIASKEDPYSTLGYLTYIYRLHTVLREKTPPSVHIHSYRILEETRIALREKRFKDLYIAFKELNKEIIKPVFRGIYEKDVGGFETVLLPQLEVLEDIKEIDKAIKLLDKDKISEAIKVLDRLPRARIIPGIEYKINHTNIKELVEMLKHNIKLKHNILIILLEEKRSLLRLLEYYYHELATKLARIADKLIEYRIKSKHQ